VVAKEQAGSLFWISTLRVVAALAVVVLHTSHFFVINRDNVAPDAWWVGNLIDSAVRWCVPVFVMVSGALLLDPSRHEDALAFARKRAGRVLTPLVFWTIFYLAFRIIFQNLQFGEIRRLLAEGIPYYHLWYLFMIPGLYLVTPFLRTYIRHSEDRERWYLILVLLLLAAINGYVTYFQRADTQSVFTLFVPYIAYYLAGYQLRRLDFRGSPVWLLLGEFLGCIALTAIGAAILYQRYGHSFRGLYFYDYFSAPVMGAALSLFVLMRFAVARNGAGLPVFLRNLIRALEPATLGIYVVHALLLAIVQGLGGLDPNRVPPIVGIPAVALAVFAGSYLITWGMLRVPLLRRTVS